MVYLSFSETTLSVPNNEIHGNTVTVPICLKVKEGILRGQKERSGTLRSNT